MKTFTLITLLFLAAIESTLLAQESENKQYFNEAGDIKMGLAGVPLLDLDNGYSGTIIKPSISFYVSKRVAISTSAFILFPQDIELESGGDAELQVYGFMPSGRIHAINSGRFSFYLEAGVGLGAIRYEAKDPIDIAVENNNGGMLLLTAGAGIQYRFAKCFELEFGVPYSYGLNITNTNDTKLFSGVAFNLGMNIVFNIKDIQKWKAKMREHVKKKWEEKE